ncbi:hypothetical protein LCGC14_0735220 [marine sediment metagenome]|uniref:Uncharacterized protein n=1 Tax=marine sediment metagenome TaxID=412755 RepID=A0A0F9QT99_9ZZZZ
MVELVLGLQGLSIILGVSALFIGLAVVTLNIYLLTHYD